jgi:hypothetical protein
MKTCGRVAALRKMKDSPRQAQAPKGWMVRIDRSTVTSDPDAAGNLKFMLVGSTFHLVTPQSAVLWNPQNVASGNYDLKGTFKLIKSTGYYEYFGLVFGGKSLQGINQSYLYFMVNDDGTWLLKRRSGMNADELSKKTPSAWIRRTDMFGNSSNTLEVRVMDDKVAFVVNGNVVSTIQKMGPLAKTDGIYGIRSNHHLELEVVGFGLSQ